MKSMNTDSSCIVGGNNPEEKAGAEAGKGYK